MVELIIAFIAVCTVFVVGGSITDEVERWDDDDRGIHQGRYLGDKEI